MTNDVVSGSQYRGGGIMLDYEDFGNRTAPFGGTTNNLQRYHQRQSGWGDQGILQFGALMFWADNGAINAPFTVSGDEIDNSLFAAIQFDGGNAASTIAMSSVNINGAEFAFSNKVNTVTGSATNVTASGLTVGGLESCEGTRSWNITLGIGQHWLESSSTDLWLPDGNTNTQLRPRYPRSHRLHRRRRNTHAHADTSAAPSGTLVTAINAGGAASGNYRRGHRFQPGQRVLGYLDLDQYQ